MGWPARVLMLPLARKSCLHSSHCPQWNAKRCKQCVTSNVSQTFRKIMGFQPFTHVFDEMPHSPFRALELGRACGSGLCTTTPESEQEFTGLDPSLAWPCQTPPRGCGVSYAPSR
jgi:hypothetical protein